MKKFFTLVTVLFVLLFWSCSSSQEKECECPPPAQSQDDSKSQQTADNKTATRSGEAEQGSGEKDQSKSEQTASTTKTEESKPSGQQGTNTKSGEAEKTSTPTTSSSQAGSYPDPKTPIAQKPLNTASSILGGSGEAASATKPAGTREGGSGESQSDGTTRDQIRKIDRESEYVIPPQVVPLKGGQSNNQTTPAPQGAGGSFSLKCEDYNEDTKSVVCRGNSSSLKGDAVLEFDARKFKKLFMGFDLTLRSGEIEVQIPGKDPVKATPSKPFVYLGEVQSNNNKVQVRVKAEPQEAKDIDYIVRLFYHGQG